MTQKSKKKTSPESNFFGSAIVGTKGQIVIPIEARTEYNIKPGDKLLIFGGQGGILGLMKSEEINHLITSISNNIKL